MGANRATPELKEDGIAHREINPEVPPKVEHAKTEFGKTLRSIAHVIYD